MLTDRAFACLLIAALLLCSAARQVVSALRQEAEISVTRQSLLGLLCVSHAAIAIHSGCGDRPAPFGAA